MTDDSPQLVTIEFEITHMEWPCFICGKMALNKFVGTFVAPYDGLEYPVFVCKEHEDRFDGK